MKTYKVNNVEVSAEQIKEIIKNNPELLEESNGGRYFFPKEMEEYWYVKSTLDVDSITNTNDSADKKIISRGVYRTQEEAKLASDKQKAIVACWKWAQENAPFEPDWKDFTSKTYVCYLLTKKKFYICSDVWYQSQFTLPYFKSIKDCAAFIEANEEHLELLFKR